MNYKKQIESAVEFAISSNYKIYDRQSEILKRMNGAKNVCIFGLGEYFEDCFFHIPGVDRVCQYVCDNNPEKWGKQFKGRRCISPEELKHLEDVIVIIMIGNYRSIQAQLDEMGIENYPSSDIFLNAYDKKYDIKWFEERKQIIIDTLDLFEDEASKEVYTEVICNRIAPQFANKTFNDIKIGGEYYDHGIFELNDQEYMIDAGAFTGDSVVNFIQKVEGKFGAVYSFELDSILFDKLKENVAAFDLSKIYLYNAGVSNKNDEIFCTSGAVSSHVAEESGKKERIVKLDDILVDRKVTYIKMDIEGSELAALEGAKTIIRTQKPKLAISAYHYLSDLWEVPLYIRALDKTYKIYLRHHSPVAWDTNCYAY